MKRDVYEQNYSLKVLYKMGKIFIGSYSKLDVRA